MAALTIVRKVCSPEEASFRHDAMASNDCSAETWSQAPGVYLLTSTGVRRPCVVEWTALPLISWLFPFVGHVGISTSEGEVTDFAGPYHVGVGALMCGPARRVWALDIIDREAYDAAVHAGAICYGRRMHKYVVSAIAQVCERQC
jgi:hypothetical protein